MSDTDVTSIPDSPYMDHSVVIMRNRWPPPLTRLERLIGKSAEERRNKRSHLRKAVSALMEEVG
jgi:hypothetical protein